MAPTQCFISYSHSNHAQYLKLREGLRALGKLYNFNVWSDSRIKPGHYWNQTIQDEIDRSQIFICATSNAFFSSDYIFDHELPAILHQHQSANALVLPVLLSESPTLTYYGNYIDILPKDGQNNLKPLSRWRNKDEAFGTVTKGIEAAITAWFGIKPAVTFGNHPTSGGGTP